MKTLTIKELAPYLPYGLEFKATDIDSGEFDILMIRSIDFANEELEIGATTFEFSDLGSDILKPILRPLSDLTKEIEHNGEKFVPIKELSAYSRGQTEERRFIYYRT